MPYSHIDTATCSLRTRACSIKTLYGNEGSAATRSCHPRHLNRKFPPPPPPLAPPSPAPAAGCTSVKRTASSGQRCGEDGLELQNKAASPSPPPPRPPMPPLPPPMLPPPVADWGSRCACRLPRAGTDLSLSEGCLQLCKASDACSKVHWHSAAAVEPELVRRGSLHLCRRDSSTACQAVVALGPDS